MPYTPRQGQFLAFIHYYTTIHGRAPAEADIVSYFQISSASVHGMVLTLERRGLIKRELGLPRSIRVTLPREKLPDLQ
jgi:DNA-binding MarR family transcriptional regulator